MSNDVTVKLHGDSRDLNQALNESQGAVKQYAGAIKGVLAGLATAFVIKEAFSFGSSMIELYKVQEAAETKMASVLRATGSAAGYSLEQLKHRASALQEQIGIGDEVILNSQAILATFRNIRGDSFEQATVAAADMASVLGGDLNSTILQVGKALNDPLRGMAALSRSGVSFTQTQKDLVKSLQESGDMMGAQKVILDELAGEFGGAAADKANTFGGQMTKLWNRIGDIGETIGKALIPAVSAVIPLMEFGATVVENLAGGLQAGGEAAGEFATSWSEFFVDVLKDSMLLLSDAMSLGEYLFGNFTAIISREATAWTLSVVQAMAEIEHLFTEVAPAYLEWFAENWGTILDDMVSYGVTILGNMWKNVADFMQGLITLVSTGSAEDFKITPLLEGFELTTKALPEIAARGVSAFEKQLKDDLKGMDKALDESFTKTFNKNRDFVEGLFNKSGPIAVDMTANFDPVEAEAVKTKDKVKVLAQKASKDLQDTKAEQQAAGNGASGVFGSTIDLVGLNKSIQEAAFKEQLQAKAKADEMGRQFQFTGKDNRNSNPVVNDLKGLRGGLPLVGEAGLSSGRQASMDAEAKAEAKAGNKTLTEIKDAQASRHTEMIRALQSAGGVV